MNPARDCKELSLKGASETLVECTTALQTPNVNDLNVGLAFFGKVGQLLMCSAKQSNVESTSAFVNKLPD